MADKVIWLNIVLIVLAMLDIDSATHHMNEAAAKAQKQCDAYFDEINKGHGA